MQVLVIGANGNTGTRVVKLLKDGPHEPIAMIRNTDQKSKFDELGVPSVLGDLNYTIDHVMTGHDAVIFAAGSGGDSGKDQTVLIDQLGGIRAAVTAYTHGIKRFIMLSAYNADMHSKSKIKHYHRAKGFADHFIRTMDEVLDYGPLDYTIVCPASLFDGPGTGKVTITTDIFGKARTSRDNTALTLVKCLDHENTVGKTFAVLEGDTPIDEAVKNV